MANGAEAVFRQGAAALEANDFAAAERLFRSIVDADPRAHPAWNALSVVAVRAGLPDVAAAHAERALQLDRRNPVYLNNLGVALGELGRFEEAEQAFRRALKARPVYAEGLFNLGKVLHKRARLADSLRAYERAYAIDARFPGLRESLANMYRKHGRADRALTVLKEGPEGIEDGEMVPLTVQVLAEVEGVEAAIAWLEGLNARYPKWYNGRFSLAMLLLSRGRWREGWRHFTFRHNMLADRVGPDGAPRNLPAPLPSRLDGVSLRLRGEQGLGDILFFLRFTAELLARGASASVVVPPKLAPVLRGGERLEFLAGESDGLTWRAGSAQGAGAYDLPLGDLPAVLETEAAPPAFAPALDAARVAACRERLARLGPAPYLGLTWRAGTDVLRNQEFGRSRAFLSKELPLAELGAAVRGWRGTLLALQRGPYQGEIEAISGAAGAPVHDLSALNDDLPEMLAALAAIDEHVAVSNTNIHLLAGIGRTARVLVPYPPEWRWMREGDSPWFPGFPVYREPQSRGWAEPLAKLRTDLIG
ncbi:MAG TPA: tetratricopeptide repeat protein [Burkholderiales bacterium]